MDWRAARAEAERHLTPRQRLQVARAQAKRLLEFRSLTCPHCDLRFQWRADVGVTCPRCLEKFDPDQPRDEDGKWTDGGGSDGGSSGSGGGGKPKPSGPRYSPPHTPDQIETGKKVEVQSAYRGSESKTEPKDTLRESKGDLGKGVYLTLERSLAGSYGGGPGASESAGTRVVREWSIKPVFPEEAAFVFGGRKVGENAEIHSGNGIKLGDVDPTKSENFDAVLDKHPDIKIVIGTPTSIGVNQISIRDKSIIAEEIATPKTPAEHAAQIVASVPGAAAKIAAAREKLKQEVRTDAPVAQGGHKLPNGRYTPEREQLHNTMLKAIFTPAAIRAATPAPGEKPVAHLIGGAGGSGKSYFVGPNGTIDKSKAVYLNSDDVKAALPEYKGFNAAALHEESSTVAKAAEVVARENGLNVVIDGTMGSEKALRQRIADYKAAGYRVEGHFMRVKPETSAKRAIERFMRGGETGRLVDPVLLLTHSATQNFEKARELMDKWELFDNEGKKPELVSRG